MYGLLMVKIEVHLRSFLYKYRIIMKLNMPTAFIKTGGVMGGVSSILSLLGFVGIVKSPYWNAYSLWIIFASLILVLVGIFINKLKSNKTFSIPIIVFGSIFLALSLLTRYIDWTENRKIEKSELLSDATSSLLDMLDNEWIVDAAESGKLVCMLFPKDKAKNYYKLIYDELIAKNVYDPKSNQRLNLLAISPETDIPSEVKYFLCVSDQNEIRDCFRNDKQITILPECVNDVVRGWIRMRQNQFQSARAFFEKADSSGNATGTYFLSKWYGTGFGSDPDSEKEISLLKKAAQDGCRIARFEWSERIIKNPPVKDIQGGFAEDFLQRASTMKSIYTSYTITNSFKSLQLLNEYYRITERYKEAYKTSEAFYRHFRDPQILYYEHLDNCLSSNKYKEAMEIVKMGEKEKCSYCYIIHAGMLTHGQGVKQDFEKAEYLLRYAADSLNYYPAYKGLAVLYDSSHKKGSDFWESLYDVKFDNQVE